MRQFLPMQAEVQTPAQIAACYRWQEPPADRPWVRMNFTQAIDGSVRGRDGLSAGVSNAIDKRVFTILRATCDAVLVGAGTARAEDYGPVHVSDELWPLRRDEGRDTDPRLYVVSRSGNINEKAKSAATVIRTEGNGDELREALRNIRAAGVSRLLCEGGPTLFTSLLAAGLVDDLCLTTTPLLLGNDSTSLVTELLPTDQHAQLATLLVEESTVMMLWQLDHASSV